MDIKSHRIFGNSFVLNVIIADPLLLGELTLVELFVIWFFFWEIEETADPLKLGPLKLELYKLTDCLLFFLFLWTPEIFLGDEEFVLSWVLHPPVDEEFIVKVYNSS